MISSIILAAGRSTRMGGANKLLLPVEGRAVLERVLDLIVSAALGEVIVITGAEAERVSVAVAGRSVRLVHNAEFEEGLASSIRAGVAAADPEALGYAIFMGDMPFIAPETVGHLAGVFRSRPDGIVVPLCGRRGHPVLFARRFREELSSLRGDVGARSVMQSHRDSVVEVETEDEGVLFDLDTPEQYHRVTSQ